MSHYDKQNGGEGLTRPHHYHPWRCRYVRESLLSVAPYPTTLQI